MSTIYAGPATAAPSAPPADEVERLRIENRNALVESTQALVPWVLKRLRLANNPLADEMLSEGYLALVRAADKYDPARGKFSTLAVFVVRREMLRVLQTTAGVVRLPSNLTSDKQRAARRRLRQVHLATMGTDDKAAFELPAPDDEPDPGIAELGDQLPRLHDAIESLPARWRCIVKLRLAGCTLKEAGKCFLITRERVRQIEERAVAKLRTMLLVDHPPASA